MRDHTKLRAFKLADGLVLEVYKLTKSFPREEQFGLTSQMRRAALSVASNIVEGCARRTAVEYARFLDMAYGSCRELGYQLSVAYRLGYIRADKHNPLHNLCEETSKVLNGLRLSIRLQPFFL